MDRGKLLAVSLSCSYHFNNSSLTAYHSLHVTVTKFFTDLEYISEYALAGPQLRCGGVGHLPFRQDFATPWTFRNKKLKVAKAKMITTLLLLFLI